MVKDEFSSTKGNLTREEVNRLKNVKSRAWTQERVVKEDGNIHTRTIRIEDRLVYPHIAHTIDHQPVTSDFKKWERGLRRKLHDWRERRKKT